MKSSRVFPAIFAVMIVSVLTVFGLAWWGAGGAVEYWNMARIIGGVASVLTVAVIFGGAWFISTHEKRNLNHD